MGNRSGTRYGKFFRRQIASADASQLDAIIERYQNDLERAEDSYTDILLHTNGSISYTELMGMPIPAIKRYVDRLNHLTEQREESRKKNRR